MSSLLEQYLEARQISIQELEALLDKAEQKGIRSLAGREIEKLGSLYLRATTQLAQLKSRELEGEITEQLNDLAARAHAILYSQPPAQKVQLRTFFTRTFPQLVARTWPFHLTALLLLGLGTGVGYKMTAVHPAYYYSLLPGDERTPGASREELHQILTGGRQWGSGVKTAFASDLFFHNTKVGLLSWAAGILFGIPSLLLTFYNGLTLGAMTQVYSDAGLLYEWGWWVLPHGVTELLAIALFSGAGLFLGYSLIDPGGKSRQWVLKERGLETLRIGAGGAVMLLVAAVIESFIRQSELPPAARYAIVFLSVIAWLAYFWPKFKTEREK